MHNSLWDSLTIEMSEEIDEMEVLEEKRPVCADALCGFWVVGWSAVGGRVDGHVVQFGIEFCLLRFRY